MQASQSDGDEARNLEKIYHELIELLTQIYAEVETVFNIRGSKAPKTFARVSLLTNSMISIDEMIKQNPVFDGFKKPKTLLQNIF